MKHSYISNTYWNTDTLRVGNYSANKSYWEIVDDDYVGTTDSSDIRTYKIIRDEK